MFQRTGPADDRVFSWTKHAKYKMRFYGLSAQRVKRVVRYPTRLEEAILPGAIGAMRPAGTAKKPSEIWVMYVPYEFQKK